MNLQEFSGLSRQKPRTTSLEKSVCPKGHQFCRKKVIKYTSMRRNIPYSLRQKQYYDFFKNYITIINDHLYKTVRRSDILLSVTIHGRLHPKKVIFYLVSRSGTLSFWLRYDILSYLKIKGEK